jgi:hypothetical protein
MNRVCEQAEAIVQIDDRIVIADDVEFEGSTSIHYGGLCGAFCYLVSTSIQSLGLTFIRIAPSLAEFSEYMIRANTTGSAVCTAVKGDETGGRSSSEDSENRESCENRTRVAMATAKSRIICRGRTRKGSRPSYNEKGVFWTLSRLSNCKGCRGVRERGEEVSEDIWNEKDEGVRGRKEVRVRDEKRALGAKPVEH